MIRYVTKKRKILDISIYIIILFNFNLKFEILKIRIYQKIKSYFLGINISDQSSKYYITLKLILLSKKFKNKLFTHFSAAVVIFKDIGVGG